MYDALSTDYDRFVSWPGRLSFELPFLEQQLQIAGATSVLDAACGTGMHAVALAQRGYRVAGADLSTGMVERAYANAAAAQITAQFTVAGFGELAQAFQESSLFPFDALLCLGNSLVHLLTPEDLGNTLKDFADCLRPGGLLLIQNRNFDAVLMQKARWMEPQAYQESGSEWIFLRFYDFQPDGIINFNIITLKRRQGESWQQHITSTLLYPLRQGELTAALRAADFAEITLYGDMAGAPFHPESSGNLVITAKRAPISGWHK